MKHDPDCNVWKTSQQCDGPDETRKCTCIELLEVKSKIDVFKRQTVNNK